MSEKRVVTAITIQEDSVVVKGADFDWLCSMARDMERFGAMFGLDPDKSTLCHEGHAPIIHFGECPVCSGVPQSEGT